MVGGAGWEAGAQLQGVHRGKADGDTGDTSPHLGMKARAAAAVSAAYSIDSIYRGHWRRLQYEPRAVSHSAISGKQYGTASTEVSTY